MTVRFGTDGVRGLANAELTPELVVALGRAAARVLARPGQAFLVGRDTRVSGPLLQAALSAGLAAEGVDVWDLGVLPTPGVAALSADRDVPAAVISASHNPFADNGIKLFAAGGCKLRRRCRGPVGSRAGRRPRCDRSGVARCRASGRGPDQGSGSADGSSSRTVREPMTCRRPGTGRRQRGRRSAASATTPAPSPGTSVISWPRSSRAPGRDPRRRGLRQWRGGRRSPRRCSAGPAPRSSPSSAVEPDGFNINAGCGSTYPAGLQAAVIAHRADVGPGLRRRRRPGHRRRRARRPRRRRPAHRPLRPRPARPVAAWPATPWR